MWKQNIYIEEKKEKEKPFGPSISGLLLAQNLARGLTQSPAQPICRSLPHSFGCCRLSPRRRRQTSKNGSRQPARRPLLILVLPKENKGRQLPSKEDEKGPADWIGKPSKLTVAYFLAKKP